MNVRYKMNFSPKLLNSTRLISSIKFNKIYCRNFIFTILAFDILNHSFNSTFQPMRYKIHITKKRKHIGSILRAPYKSKSAQFSLGLYRYYLVLSFSINSGLKAKLNNYTDFIYLVVKLLNSYNYFESTLVTQISRSISIPVHISII